jgi:nitrate/TMAO reductase-like tetraheme cytochrome c subunit
MKKSVFVILCFISIVACTSTKKVAGKKESAPAKVEDVSLKQGLSLYEQNCGLCHELKKPQDFTEAQWAKIVPNMVQKVNKKAVIEAITPEKEQLLMKYLVSVCKK